ncbi:glycoside hydrolase family 5 protein [Streptomyces sp. NPDC015127]|uniref:glycoside hydrolase family 5 protein n=1 Tax=Streptomyces sp. NPDC015127 TaxID=3364939 RepID=UPI0036FD576D
MRRSLNSSGRWVVRSALVMASALGLLAVNTACGDATGSATHSRTPVKNGISAKHATPVRNHGTVRVCGAHLCDESGNPVQLRGMSTHGTQWYAHCLTDGALDALAYDWKVDVLRVATYAREGGYETNPRKFTELASRLIDRASARGMYVIVDWHMINPGDPHEDLAEARTFFEQIAERHKHRNNVLYEIANEPHGVSWERIKSYADAVIPVIRSRDPDSVILVPTPAWSSLGLHEFSDEKTVVNAPLSTENVMYAFHFYAPEAREASLAALDRASATLPMFVTEWGTASWKGYGNDFPMAQKFVDLMAKKKISWTNWAVSDNERDLSVFKRGACSAGTFAGTGVLKPAGVWVRERIRS